MESQESKRITGLSILRFCILFIIGVAILGGASYAALYFIKNKPKAKRKKVSNLTPIVEVTGFKSINRKVVIKAMGVVVPEKEITLRPRVSGTVQKVHKNFISGGIINKGETIIELDDTDYELVLNQKKAALKKVEYSLELEEGKQHIAKNQFKLFQAKNGNSKSNSRKRLILRLPQQNSIKADISIAKSNVRKATLDLKRTKITSPFNAIIKSTDVQIGDQTNPQTSLAKLVGIDTYRVRVSIPIRLLKWINFSNKSNQKGSNVSIKTSSGIREGRILKLLSNLEETGRMARILVELKDPLNLKKSHGKNRTPVLIGDYVTIKITGRTVENVIPINRNHLREGKELWLLSPDKQLRVQAIHIIWEERDKVFISNDIDKRMRVITSNIGHPIEGMKLKVVSQKKANQ